MGLNYLFKIRFIVYCHSLCPFSKAHWGLYQRLLLLSSIPPRHISYLSTTCRLSPKSFSFPCSSLVSDSHSSHQLCWTLNSSSNPLVLLQLEAKVTKFSDFAAPVLFLSGALDIQLSFQTSEIFPTWTSIKLISSETLMAWGGLLKNTLMFLFSSSIKRTCWNQNSFLLSGASRIQRCLPAPCPAVLSC